MGTRMGVEKVQAWAAGPLDGLDKVLKLPSPYRPVRFELGPLCRSVLRTNCEVFPGPGNGWQPSGQIRR